MRTESLDWVMNTCREQVQAAIDGDTDALIELLRLHDASLRQRVRPLIPREFRSVLDEDDILQETYSEALLDIVAFHAERSFEAWLYQIARHNLLDAIRGLRAEKRLGRMANVSRTRRTLHDGSSADAIRLQMLPDSSSGPSAKAARQELVGVMRSYVQTLPAAYRDVLCLHDLEELDAAQTAARLGCSKGAMYMRRCRALRMLKSVMRYMPGEETDETDGENA
jgi:RNA polymerase sigma factor (sigma-70 family)